MDEKDQNELCYLIFKYKALFRFVTHKAGFYFMDNRGCYAFHIYKNIH